MNRAFSTYLEMVRIVATLIVFFAHGVAFFPEMNQGMHIGRDGVIMFFVLSGFIITWCANMRDRTVFDYAINRASRIYSVVLPAIVLSFAAGVFVSVFQGTDLPYQLSKLWLYLPLYLGFLGSFWNLNETPVANHPYWSLNYEVWYYVIFAAFFYVRHWSRWLLVVGLLCLLGPNIVQLFPLWVVGSLLFYFGTSFKLPLTFARIGFVATIIVYLVSKIAVIDSAISDSLCGSWEFVLGQRKCPLGLLQDYQLGMLVVLNFLFALHSKLAFGPVVERCAKYIASFSFSCYLFHAPIFTILKLIFPGEGSIGIYIIAMSFASILIFLLARVTEHKKYAYRHFFKKCLALLRISPPVTGSNAR